jgi:hypothetical protein
VTLVVVVDPRRLEGHVRKLCEDFFPRDAFHLESLDRAAACVRSQFEETAARVADQLGEKERAVDLLRTAISEGFSPDPSFSLARKAELQPALDSLRGYPPFEELVKPKGEATGRRSLRRDDAEAFPLVAVVGGKNRRQEFGTPSRFGSTSANTSRKSVVTVRSRPP